MKITKRAGWSVGLLAILTSVAATATPVSLTLGTPGGGNNNAEFGSYVDYNTGVTGLNITQIVLTTSSGIFFGSSGFASTNGSGTLTGNTGPASVTSSGTTTTITFNGFSSGEIFSYTLDFDGSTNVICGSGSGSGQTCDAGDLLGKVSFDITFAGAGHTTTVLSGTYNALATLDRNNSGPSASYATTTIAGNIPEAATIPEPATFGLIGLGLLGLGITARRRAA